MGARSASMDDLYFFDSNNPLVGVHLILSGSGKYLVSSYGEGCVCEAYACVSTGVWGRVRLHRGRG